MNKTVLGGTTHHRPVSGRHSQAIQDLRTLLEINQVSAPLLAMDPAFTPLRPDPAFRELLERYRRDSDAPWRVP